MAKVEIDLVKHILQRSNLDVRQINEIIQDIEQEVKMLQEENPAAPREKKQFAVLISDPENQLPAGVDWVGWVAQIPEDDSPASTADRLIQSAYDFNQTPKGRRMPVQSIGEACEIVPAKIHKEHKVWVKTKVPVWIVPTDNSIPVELKAD